MRVADGCPATAHCYLCNARPLPPMHSRAPACVGKPFTRVSNRWYAPTKSFPVLNALGVPSPRYTVHLRPARASFASGDAGQARWFPAWCNTLGHNKQEVDQSNLCGRLHSTGSTIDTCAIMLLAAGAYLEHFQP
jgi:hypothetical protein